MVIVPLLIVYYTRETVLAAGWSAPGSLAAFFCISFLSCSLAIRPLVRQVAEQERAEGDFRYLHVHLRDHAEAISLLHGQGREEQVLQDSLRTCLAYQRAIIQWNVLVKFLTNLVDYCGALVSYSVVAVPILGGVYGELDG